MKGGGGLERKKVFDGKGRGLKMGATESENACVHEVVKEYVFKA